MSDKQAGVAFEWRDRIEGDPHNKEYGGIGWDTEKVGVIGDQVVCRIMSRLQKGSTWMKEYKAKEIYDEGKGGSSSRHIKSSKCNIQDVQAFCEKYLFGAINQRDKCSSCGRLATGTKQDDDGNVLCFSCSEWLRRQSLLSDPLVAIINGAWYTIDPREDMPNNCKGFGGRRIEISFFDERENKITTNLWHGGECPEHLRHLFPDSAQFVKEQP